MSPISKKQQQNIPRLECDSPDDSAFFMPYSTIEEDHFVSHWTQLLASKISQPTSNQQLLSATDVMLVCLWACFTSSHTQQHLSSEINIFKFPNIYEFWDLCYLSVEH